MELTFLYIFSKHQNNNKKRLVRENSILLLIDLFLLCIKIRPKKKYFLNNMRREKKINRIDKIHGYITIQEIIHIETLAYQVFINKCFLVSRTITIYIEKYIYINLIYTVILFTIMIFALLNGPTHTQNR